MKTRILTLLFAAFALAAHGQSTFSVSVDGSGNIKAPGTLTFPSSKSLQINGTLGGTPTGGTLNLSNLTLTLPADVTRLGSSISLTSEVTGTLPVANGGTGITALGTGIATALGVNVGSAGAPVLFNGAGGTPSAITLTNGTGLPLTTGITGTLSEANGGTGATVRPRFSASMAADQTVSTATWTKMQFGSEEFDSGTVFDPATNYRFTVPANAAGTYFFSARVMPNGSTGGNAEVALYKNGSKIESLYYNSAPPGATNTQTGTAILALSVSDYVEVFVYQDSGSNRDYRGFSAYTQFYGFFVAP